MDSVIDCKNIREEKQTVVLNSLPLQIQGQIIIET
jgi:hypothetical protein